jgi:hypothetical protein
MADGSGSTNRIISPEFIVPEDTDELMAEVEEMMRFHALIATRVEVVAAGLRKGLANPIGTKRAWSRMDLRVNASRVARPVVHVAALESAASRSWGQAFRTFNRLYAGAPAKQHERGFRV